MIGKEKLLKQIDRLLAQEDSLIPLLNRHISSALFFSRLTDVDRESIVDHFQEMVIKQREHLEILQGMKKEVTEGESNVY